MQLIDRDDMAEFERILRQHRMVRSDFSVDATDITDPKTDEIPGLQAEVTVRRASTGRAKHYLFSDSSSWLELFRNDINGGAFVGQDRLQVRATTKR